MSVAVSIIALTMDRLDLTAQTYEHNLKNTGNIDYELLVCDQGSRGPEVIKFIESYKPRYFRRNLYNEGISRALNQLILRARGRHLFFMPNDILLPDNWLERVVWHADKLPRTGIVGFEGQDLILPKVTVHLEESDERFEICYQQEKVLEGCQVFGAILITKNLIDTIGYFDEKYHPYAFEDSDICFRAHMAGLLCYYIPGLISKHIGERNDPTPVKFKQDSYWANVGYHRWKMQNYGRIGVYEPAPPPRGPMT